MNQRLKEIEDRLPPPISPVGNYVFVKRTGDLAFTSGIIPLRDGKLVATGKLGGGLSVEQGAMCARICAENALSLVLEALGCNLEAIREVVSLRAIVSSTPDFIEHAKVANGASDFLVEVFGDSGKHTRSAFGAPSLPLDAPVEIEFVFRIEQ
ncbi:MAG: RidA family protein [bacterium]|jgi:enamine deaminase RidA (YjgF/YER057c/UK114 family)